MGVLQSGLVGQIRKKTGNFVFSNWKGINTARAYAIPANPNTVPQQQQRSKFKSVVQLASSLLSTLIVTFWNPFSVGMSGFNSFVKSVFANVTSTGLATPLCEVTKGTLEGVSNLAATYTTATGVCDIIFSSTIKGNGLNTDKLNVLVLDKTTNAVIFYGTNIGERADGEVNPIIGSGLLAANLISFAWFSRGTGSEFMVSNSSGVQTVAP